MVRRGILAQGAFWNEVTSFAWLQPIITLDDGLHMWRLVRHPSHIPELQANGSIGENKGQFGVSLPPELPSILLNGCWGRI